MMLKFFSGMSSRNSIVVSHKPIALRQSTQMHNYMGDYLKKASSRSLWAGFVSTQLAAAYTIAELIVINESPCVICSTAVD